VHIAEVATAIIALAIGATLLAGLRLVRPLRALTAAAHGVEANGFAEVAEVSGTARAALSGPAAGVTITLACLDTVVVADPDRLRQIVQNLVSNAIRHSHPSGSVHIRAASQDDCLSLDVIDHGTGIAAADLPRIYDRFWRAEKSRSRAAGGSGLGLAAVRQLAEAHGGTVSARSIPGEETVFSVLLPTVFRNLRAFNRFPPCGLLAGRDLGE